MKNLLRSLTLLLVVAFSATEASAQIKDGDASVLKGSTTTVSIGAAYQSTLNRATGINYTWSAGSSAISIQSKTNKTCTIKGNSVGTAKLNYKCSYYIDGYLRSMDFYYDITITSNSISVTRLEVSPTSATLDVGESFQVKVTVYPTNATNKQLVWDSLNPAVATVDNNGVVTAKSPGSTSIFIAPKDNEDLQYWVSVNVNAPTKVSAIELSEKEKTLTIGSTFQLSANVLPANAQNKEVVWASSDENIAMESNGAVTAKNAGECDITCRASDGSNVSASCHVTVPEPDPIWLSVNVPNGIFAINVIGMEQTDLKITPDDGYIINSISLDGVELTHDNGVIAIPKLTENASLNIVFEAETITGIESIDGDNEDLKVMVTDRTVAISGLQSAKRTQVYDTNGALILNTTENVFDLPRAGIYILRIGRRSLKLAIR